MSDEATADLFPSGIGVTCEACGRPFVATVRYEPTPDGGELICFDCPHCARRYEAAVISPRGVALRARLQRALAMARPRETARQRKRSEKQLRRVARLRRELEREVRRVEW